MTSNKNIIKSAFYLICLGLISSCAPLYAQSSQYKRTSGSHKSNIAPVVVGAAAIGALIYLNNKTKSYKKTSYHSTKCPCGCGHHTKCASYTNAYNKRAYSNQTYNRSHRGNYAYNKPVYSSNYKSNSHRSGYSKYGSTHKSVSRTSSR